jgi:hypothetical protein
MEGGRRPDYADRDGDGVPSRRVGGYCITPDWVHLDLAPAARSAVEGLRIEGMLPLFDHTGQLLPQGPVPRPSLYMDPYFPAEVVDWYFYMLGNLVVVIGRNEPILAANGAIIVRDTCLVPLLMAERGVRRAGGNKRQRMFLTAEQYGLLTSLPPLEATLDSAIDFQLALAPIFVPRGRLLANATGGTWPDAFESATLRHLEDALGVRLQIR